MNLELRCAGLEHHGNIFYRGDKITVEVKGPKGTAAEIVLEEIDGFRPEIMDRKEVLCRLVLKGGWQNEVIHLGEGISVGYHLLHLKAGRGLYSTYFYLNSREAHELSVVYPLFTQWSYHADGFYPNHDHLLAERIFHKLDFLGPVRNVFFRRNPEVVFPKNDRISLKMPYRTNKRWDRSRRRILPEPWKDGLWCDELFVTIPVLAWLKRIGRSLRFFSDLDLHRGNPDIAKARTIVFFGQEGFTEGMIANMKKIFESNIPCLFLGGQALGYRQYAYDEYSGTMAYVATRGDRGLWGEKLEDIDPTWSPEGALFGFQFPLPSNKDWRYKKPLKGWSILSPKDPVFNGIEGNHYEYSLNLNGKEYLMLTYLGGEYLKRFSQEAKVLACLDDEEEIIGCGRFHRNLYFSPTYWPFFGFFQEERHPEVFKILDNGLRWCLEAGGYPGE